MFRCSRVFQGRRVSSMNSFVDTHAEETFDKSNSIMIIIFCRYDFALGRSEGARSGRCLFGLGLGEHVFETLAQRDGPFDWAGRVAPVLRDERKAQRACTGH